MATLVFPFGKEKIEYTIEDTRLQAVLTSGLSEYIPAADGAALVKAAMAEPIGSARLSELARGKDKVVIIASDHTRPVPSKVIIPFMLSEIREGNPHADITILIATGCHRGTTREELVAKFGEEIVNTVKICVHDCEETDMLVNIGTLPSGGACLVNKLAAEADLLLAEGFIEPHFFAGYSGGRKSVLPGVCSKETVLANHCAEFIDSPYARTGILENNPIHKDMLWAAKAAGLAYIVNVVLNEEKEAIYAVAGDDDTGDRRRSLRQKRICGTPGRGGTRRRLRVPFRVLRRKGDRKRHRYLHKRRLSARPEYLSIGQGYDSGRGGGAPRRRDHHACLRQRWHGRRRVLPLDESHG